MSGVLTSLIWKKVMGGPDKLPAPPKMEPKIPIAPKAPPKAENAPGANDITSNAAVAEERRRILSMAPSATEKEFAGESGVTKKKRLLGDGGSGSTTTGE